MGWDWSRFMPRKMDRTDLRKSLLIYATAHPGWHLGLGRTYSTEQPSPEFLGLSPRLRKRRGGGTAVSKKTLCLSLCASAHLYSRELNACLVCMHVACLHSPQGQHPKTLRCSKVPWGFYKHQNKKLRTALREREGK